jgi:glycosyltransferase involved in cell wall biosynthesis
VNASSDTSVDPAAVLRVLHVFRAPIGGLFRHVCDLAAEQARLGHRVGVICDETTGGAAAEEQLSRLVSHCALGLSRIPMARTLSRRDATAVREIRRQVEALRPDIVHGHGAKGGAYARLLPRDSARLVIYTPHGGALHYRWSTPSGAVFLALEKLLRRRTNGFIFESEFGFAAYRAKVGTPSCPVRVIPNGLATEDFATLPAGTPQFDVVFVGELRRLKGVATLIDAAGEIGHPLRVGIAGTGPDEAEFRAQVANRGLSGSISFLGYRPAREVFASGRVVVIPSLAESFPYIVLEALASARPVVATSVGGIPEIFGPLSDTLVQPGNATALANALRQALDRTDDTQTRATRLRERVFTQFSAARMAEDITGFYAELRALRRGAGADFSEFLNPRETTAI